MEDGRVFRPDLDDERDWGKDLSPGQKQKLAFARLFYHRPSFVVLDECTNGISPDVEKALYQRCTTMNLGVFSISHKIELKEFHDYELHYRSAPFPFSNSLYPEPSPQPSTLLSQSSPRAPLQGLTWHSSQCPLFPPRQSHRHPPSPVCGVRLAEASDGCRGDVAGSWELLSCAETKGMYAGSKLSSGKMLNRSVSELAEKSANDDGNDSPASFASVRE